MPSTSDGVTTTSTRATPAHVATRSTASPGRDTTRAPRAATAYPLAYCRAGTETSLTDPAPNVPEPSARFVEKTRANRREAGSKPNDVGVPATACGRGRVKAASFAVSTLSPVGGLLALKLSGTPFSVSSGIGFIALFGVSVQTAVIYISYANELRRDGGSIVDATRQAAILRLRPIMMTALVAALGLLPAALSHGIGSDTQRPFALVIVGWPVLPSRKRIMRKLAIVGRAG